MLACLCSWESNAFQTCRPSRAVYGADDGRNEKIQEPDNFASSRGMYGPGGAEGGPAGAPGGGDPFGGGGAPPGPGGMRTSPSAAAWKLLIAAAPDPMGGMGSSEPLPPDR